MVAAMTALQKPKPDFALRYALTTKIQSIPVIRPPGYRAKSVIGPIVVRYGSS